MDTQKQSIIDRVKQANNILVTVSKNPSVDQLAAAIGYTLALNKVGKHAIAVFSGQAPSVIEFLKPEETFEKTTDSLRDFIISLDKAKADKLRYKVEDEHVKIFITPYRTSLTDKDLEFSQGDFNVEVIIALGVKEQGDLDDAITAQGRILHDATVVDINTSEPGKIGTLIWSNPKASSLCEMVLGITEPMKEKILDAQMATAFLTGIVAETERFSNEKTTPETMQASSKLMAAGANQQLVATELEPPESAPTELPPPVEVEPSAEPATTEVTPVTPSAASEPAPEPEESVSQDGALEISHGDEGVADEGIAKEYAPEEEQEEQEVSQIKIDDKGQIMAEGEEKAEPPSQVSTRGMTLEPPTLGGQLTANTQSETLDPSVDIIGAGANAPSGAILTHQPFSQGVSDTKPQTLSDLEEAVNSPHLDVARSAVNQAASSNSEPIVLNGAPTLTVGAPAYGVIGNDPGLPKDETATDVIDPVAPPPVPPPMMPPNFMPPAGSDNNPL